jgi:hypothetical protein
MILCVIIAVSGCNKNGVEHESEGEGGNNEYFMSFKADGTAIEYKSNTITQLLPASDKGLYSCILQGYKDFPTTDDDLMSLIIWSRDPIATKTYRNAVNVVNTDEDEIPEIVLTYLNGDGPGYLSQNIFLPATPGFEHVLTDAEITLTEINDSFVTGIFSGTLYKSTDATFTTTIKITDGKFKLKRL